MKTTKCLAYIWPAEDFTGKEAAWANIKYINGPYEGMVARYQLPTSIYRYYYWGVTFEVVTLDQNGAIISVSDVNKEDLAAFGMGIIHALTFNSATREVLGSNGFVYKLDQSLFCRYCKPVCEYIFQQIETARNFVMQMYTLNGGIIAILFDKDIDSNSNSYKYAIHRGFVTADNQLLRNMVPKVTIADRNNAVLKQPDIDKLIEQMMEGIPHMGYVESLD